MVPGKPWKNPQVKITVGNVPSRKLCVKFFSIMNLLVTGSIVVMTSYSLRIPEGQVGQQVPESLEGLANPIN